MLRYQYHETRSLLYYSGVLFASISVWSRMHCLIKIKTGVKREVREKERKKRSRYRSRRKSPIKARTIKTHTSLQSKQFCNTITDNNTNISKSIRLHNNRNNTRHDKSDHYQRCVHVCRTNETLVRGDLKKKKKKKNWSKRRDGSKLAVTIAVVENGNEGIRYVIVSEHWAVIVANRNTFYDE